jgi:hypothetical protein
MVGDGGDNANSRSDGNEGRCNVEEMVVAMAEAAAEKMAVVKETTASTAEAMAGGKDSRDNAEVDMTAKAKAMAEATAAKMEETIWGQRQRLW